MQGQTLQVTLHPRGTTRPALALKIWELYRTAASEQFPVTAVSLTSEYAQVPGDSGPWDNLGMNLKYKST